jgi:hypothetical protein
VNSGTLLAVAALLVLGAGMILQVLEIALGGWPTLVPILLMSYALPFLAWGIWARRHAPGTRAPWPARYASPVGLALMAAGFLVYRSGETQSRSVERMTWTPAVGSTSGAAEVELRFVDAPEHFVRIDSERLEDHLAEAASPEVEAEFEVTRWLGRVRSFRLVRVDTLSGLRTTAAGHSCVGRCARSPW